MYSREHIEALAFIGAPCVFYDICLIYPLKVGEVIGIKSSFDIYLQTLTINRSFIIRQFQKKKVDMSPSDMPTPFEFIMESARLDDTFLLELTRAFSTFIKEEVTILPDIKKVIVGSFDDLRFIDESNFTEFQNIIRLQNELEIEEEIPQDESPMARKFREKRELRDAVKKNQQSGDEVTFQQSISAICVYGIGITPFNIKDLSMKAFYNLLRTSGSKEKYETEMNYLYNGADPKKLKPTYWINNKN